MSEPLKTPQTPFYSRARVLDTHKLDPFARATGPCRQSLVLMLVEAQRELVTDERAALRRLGHAIAQYLDGTSPSIEHALGIVKPGSHLTPVVLARRLRKTG